MEILGSEIKSFDSQKIEDPTLLPSKPPSFLPSHQKPHINHFGKNPQNDSYSLGLTMTMLKMLMESMGRCWYFSSSPSSPPSIPSPFLSRSSSRVILVLERWRESERVFCKWVDKWEGGWESVPLAGEVLQLMLTCGSKSTNKKRLNFHLALFCPDSIGWSGVLADGPVFPIFAALTKSLNGCSWCRVLRFTVQVFTNGWWLALW